MAGGNGGGGDGGGGLGKVGGTMAQHSSSEEKKAMERGAWGVAVLLSSWAKVLHFLGPAFASREIVITAGW